MTDLLSMAGAFDAGVTFGFAVVVIKGTDPASVNIQGFVVGRDQKLDLSLFGFEPKPLAD